MFQGARIVGIGDLPLNLGPPIGVDVGQGLNSIFLLN